MLVTLSGIVILLRLLHQLKAPFPMLLTLSGMAMLVSCWHQLKASEPMLVTVLPSMVVGIVKAPDTHLSKPVIVIASPWVSYLKLGLTDTASFSPHPPRSRGATIIIRNKGLEFMDAGLIAPF
jgi:hypothetical protein